MGYPWIHWLTIISPIKMSGCWRALGSLGSLGSLDTPEVLLVLVVVMLFMIPVIVYVLSVAQLVPRVDGEAKSLLVLFPTKMAEYWSWKMLLVRKVLRFSLWQCRLRLLLDRFCIIFPIAFLFDEIFCLKNAQPKLKLHHISSYFIILFQPWPIFLHFEFPSKNDPLWEFRGVSFGKGPFCSWRFGMGMNFQSFDGATGKIWHENPEWLYYI